MSPKYRIRISYPCCEKSGHWAPNPDGEGVLEFESKTEAMKARSRLEEKHGTYECKKCGGVSRMSDATYAVTDRIEGHGVLIVDDW